MCLCSLNAIECVVKIVHQLHKFTLWPLRQYSNGVEWREHTRHPNGNQLKTTDPGIMYTKRKDLVRFSLGSACEFTLALKSSAYLLMVWLLKYHSWNFKCKKEMFICKQQTIKTEDTEKITRNIHILKKFHAMLWFAATRTIRSISIFLAIADVSSLLINLMLSLLLFFFDKNRPYILSECSRTMKLKTIKSCQIWINDKFSRFDRKIIVIFIESHMNYEI